MRLGLSQRQEQTLSPQMIQSVKLLQMNSQELLEYVDAIVQENPVLEVREHQSEQTEAVDLRRKLEWLDSTDPQNRAYHHQDSEPERDGYGSVEMCEQSLYQHILAQLKLLDLSTDMMRSACFLAGCLNDNGWIQEPLEGLSRELDQPVKLMEQALAVIQSLEPAGIGARNLSECLRLQLVRQNPVDKLAIQIVEGHLESLAKNHYGLIARALKTDQGKILRACELIRSLDPRPGSKFSAQESPVYITPDIIVAKVSDHLELFPSNLFFPALNISSYYIRLLRESEDADVQSYLIGKVQQAKWVIRAIDQRQSTLMTCVRCIVDFQAEFFLGKGGLRPMTLSDVAYRTEVHESTVSRAVHGKYIQCAMGTYPLSYFFSRSLSPATGGGRFSSTAAKTLLRSLIEQEDRRRPLSDQKLCERMAEADCILSRRTVAKYRDELGIPGAAGRKRRA